MTIAETVRNVIENEYGSGKKQREIASTHNVSRSYIQSLLTGRCPYDGITLDSLSRMFPQATLNLNGTSGITQVASNVRVNNQSVNMGKSASTYRNEAVQAMIQLDLSGDDLKKVLSTLMGIEV